MAETIAENVTPEVESTNEVENKGNAEVITLAPQRRGRKMDSTPNKNDFPPIKVLDNGDGTAIYKIQWNDENGKRCSKIETRPCDDKRGKKASDEAGKVFTVKQTRVEGTGNMELSVPYNNLSGERVSGTVTLSVNKKGNLTATVS